MSRAGQDGRHKNSAAPGSSVITGKAGRGVPGNADEARENPVVTDLVLGVVVLALLIYRQLVPRPIRSSSTRLVLILGVIGVVETVQFLQQHHQSSGTAAVTVAALLGSLVLAVAFGVARAKTVHVWLKDGVPWSRGNWLTAGLWIVALAAHLGYDALLDQHKSTHGLGTATIVLYLAVTFAVQRLIVQQRARRLVPGGGAPFFGPGSVNGTDTGTGTGSSAS
jgi:hypothetical protein